LVSGSPARDQPASRIAFRRYRITAQHLRDPRKSLTAHLPWRAVPGRRGERQGFSKIAKKPSLASLLGQLGALGGLAVNDFC